MFDIKIKKDEIFEFESVDALIVQNRRAEYKINIGGYYLYLYFNPKPETKKLYVFSPGYLERKKYQHPYYQRMSWLDSIDASGIIITDPTLSLHDDIGIAWFQGTKDKFAIPIIAKVIDIFRKSLMVENKKVLFYGSSAGGFASLMMSTLLKNSCCVVNNPQTNVIMFREKIKSEMLERCYPNTNEQTIKEFFINRLSAVRYFKANNSIPKILYIQNISDIEHYNNHLIPFLTEIGSLIHEEKFRLSFNNIIYKLYKNEQSGHNPAVHSFIKPYFELAEKEFFN